MDDMKSRMATNLVQARKAAGMTQVELARASGVKRATIANIETKGQWANPHMVERLAQALVILPAELMGWEVLSPTEANARLAAENRQLRKTLAAVREALSG